MDKEAGPGTAYNITEKIFNGICRKLENEWWSKALYMSGFEVVVVTVTI